MSINSTLATPVRVSSDPGTLVRVPGSDSTVGWGTPQSVPHSPGSYSFRTPSDAETNGYCIRTPSILHSPCLNTPHSNNALSDSLCEVPGTARSDSTIPEQVLCEEKTCYLYKKPFKIEKDGTGYCISCGRAYCVREGYIGLSECRCSVLLSPQNLSKSISESIESNQINSPNVNLLNISNVTEMVCVERTCTNYNKNFKIGPNGQGTCVCCRTYCVREGYLGYSQCRCSLYY
jgi:hypothetical protein